MADPVFDDVAAVHRVDDTIEVFGRTPGPAGTANITLVGGALLRVDYADPEALVDWSHDAAAVEAGAADPTLLPLFGHDIAAQIAEYARSGRTSPRRLLGSSNTLRRRRPGGVPADTPARRAGEFTRLADRADDDGRSLVARAAAALDVAAWSFAVDDPEPFRPAVAALRLLAAGLIDDCTDEFVLRALADERVRDLLGSPAYRALLPPSLVAWLGRDLVDWSDIPRDATIEPVHRVAALAAPMRARGVRRMVREEVVDLGPPTPVVERDGGVWEVRVPGAAGATGVVAPGWVRIFDAEQVVLAAAPFTDDGVDAVAELVVPPALGRDDVDLLLTDDPFPVVVPNALAMITRAVRAGRAAADLEGAGQPGRARTRWQECARRWDALGDHERRDAALRFADRTSLHSRDLRALGPPRLADLLTG